MRLSSFDVYPKTLSEFRQRTLTGGIVSILTIVLVLLLTCMELVDFVQVKTVEHLYVDTSRGSPPMRINIHISFPALPCSVISVDTLDLSGTRPDETAMIIEKTRLDAGGRTIPSPAAQGSQVPGGRPPERRLLFDGGGGPTAAAAGRAGAQGGGGATDRKPNGLRDLGHLAGRGDILLSALLSELLPNVFEDTEAIAELRTHLGEGCHIEGSITVQKVAGNFHFALQKADHHVLMTVFGQKESLNVSHVIHSISFGDVYPEMVNPLDDSRRILTNSTGFVQYHLKVVPTLYEPWHGEPLLTNQFSYTELFRTTQELDKFPAVYFHYEFSPIMAKSTQTRRSYSSFLTGLCAIVGGVVTVAGMLDSFLHRLTRVLGTTPK